MIYKERYKAINDAISSKPKWNKFLLKHGAKRKYINNCLNHWINNHSASDIFIVNYFKSDYNFIYSNFVWDDTPEKGNYWCDLFMLFNTQTK